MTNQDREKDKLDERSPVPLYFQLQEIIRQKILKGHYHEGRLIPSEAELQKRYNVSRITVRNALEGLVYEDLLVRKQGKGTAVAPRRMVEQFTSLKSFTEKMIAQGAKVKTRVLEVKCIGAPERIANHLDIRPEEKILYVQRLRYINNEPIALFTSYLRYDLGLKEHDDFSVSMYWLIENRCDRPIAGADKEVEATVAMEYEAELLGIQPGECVLLIRNTTYDTQGIPIEYAEGVYRSDRYKFQIKLKR